MPRRIALVLMLAIAGTALPMVSAARAQGTAPAEPPVAQTTGNGKAATTGSATGKAEAQNQCSVPTSLLGHAAIAVLPSTRWQPLNGDVQFEITGMEKGLDSISVYFAWSDVDHSKPFICLPSLRVRALPRETTDDDQTYRYAARIPALTDGSKFAITGFDHWHFVPDVVPLADMFVAGGGSAPETMFTASVGVTTPWVAIVFALGGILAVWIVFYVWVKQRTIPGGPILGIISTPNGVASLSQFQILIWTVVIGGGVVYVMMLSGNLIDIPTSTLGLLGVTGFALVGSKLKANADGSPQRVNMPGAVTNLTVVGAPASNTIVLSWVPPASADQPLGYTIQMQSGAGMWQTVKQDIAGPPYAVIGLTPATTYQFQVFATNPAGAGPAAVPVTVMTADPPQQPGGGVQRPPQLTNLEAQAEGSGIKLTWVTPAPPPDRCTVQYRPTGTFPWATYSKPASSGDIIRGLDPGTSYEFQVFGVSGGIAGTPSATAIAKTKRRTPKWSDLVMSDGANPEADLSRLQMLVFTTITAVFTGLTLINTGVIPDLPIGELALVGISNGVYLASKVSNRSGQ